jgi:ABC-type transport system involved in cytochrome bd biosynthesis fused ATPase/permease subunit
MLAYRVPKDPVVYMFTGVLVTMIVLSMLIDIPRSLIIPYVIFYMILCAGAAEYAVHASNLKEDSKKEAQVFSRHMALDVDSSIAKRLRL